VVTKKIKKMIVKEEFLSRLRKIFDLNLYEVKVWTALLSRGVSTAGELSNISDVPRSRTYDILETLEKKGFIVMKLGKPIKFVALKPEEVVERVKKNLVRGAEEKSKRLDKLKGEEILGELSDLFTQGVKFVEPSDLSGSVKGRQNVYNHLDMMIREAEKTITIVTTAAGLNRKLEALMPALEKAKKRGVIVRIATQINETNGEVAKELTGVAEVRSMPKMRGRFAIVDGQQLLFMVLDDEDVHPNYDVAIWLSTDFLANAMEQLFEAAWAGFKKI
jgi:HTH-type transcriptional regulator, sugar sensing transcriptional regulator